MEATSINPYPLHSARWILRSIASIFLLLSFALYVADGVACVNNVNYDNNYNLLDGYDTVDAVQACWTDSLYGDLRPVLIVVAAMVWNIVEFITLCINRKGIHPGAHIALDLLISFALFSAAGASYYTISVVGENPALGRYTAGAVFATIAGFLHFTLFILNAISVHKYGKGFYNGQTTTSVVYHQSGGPYASLPPPPPGMAYLVPVNGKAGSDPVGMQTVPLPVEVNLPEVHTTSPMPH